MTLSKWVAGRLSASHDQSIRVTAQAIDDNLIVVDREQRYLHNTEPLPRVEIVSVRHDVLTAQILKDIAARYPNAEFVVNVFSDARTEGLAYRLAPTLKLAFGGMGDLYRAVRLPRMNEYVHPETKYVERILRQHSAVADFERLDDSRYLINRRELPPVTVYICSNYEVTADDIRTAIDRYGDFDIFVTANPSARETSPQALEAARSSNRKAFLWPTFMGVINSYRTQS